MRRFKYAMMMSLLMIPGCLAVLSGGTFGCVVDMHGNAEAGFTQSSRWGFYHSVELDETGATGATIELQVQALMDWLDKRREADQPTVEGGD